MIPARRFLLSPFVGVTFIVVLVSLYFRSSFKSPQHQYQKRLFSAEELALYNGTDETLPILLGILGSVFDVTKGKFHYGSGGGYNHFAGRFVLLKIMWRDSHMFFYLLLVNLSCL
jgi:predicted heme/steroid binding protein